MDGFKVIKHKGLYFVTFDMDRGSVWCFKKEGAYWFEEEHQIKTVLSYLEEVEEIPKNCVTVEKPQ
jgi:hypothetical protein